MGCGAGAQNKYNRGSAATDVAAVDTEAPSPEAGFTQTLSNGNGKLQVPTERPTSRHSQHSQTSATSTSPAPPGCPPLPHEFVRQTQSTPKVKRSTPKGDLQNVRSEKLLTIGGERPGDIHTEPGQERMTVRMSSKDLMKRLPSNVSETHSPARAVGIDLGSVYSCVAAFNDLSGQVEIVTNDHGNRQTPSYIAFTGDERVVGEMAKNQVARNPRNTVFGTKQLIKRNSSDQAVQAYIETLPFQLSEGVTDEPVINVTYKGEEQKFSPTEISAMVLTKLKFTTERYLKTQVSSAVLTVPFYFRDCQRQAMKDAAYVAGFEDVTLLSETTAAAVAYLYDKRRQVHKDQMLLVLNVGWGACDASLVHITDRSCYVKAAYSHAPIGGLDFDKRIVDYCIGVFKFKNKGTDISESQRALQRLRGRCEHVKRILSSSTQAVVEVDSLFNGIDFSETISRDRFEELNKDLLQEVTVPIEKVLQESDIDRNDINDVLLVGSSVRIPKVQALVSELFGGKELCMTVDPSEAVAFGAAVYASCLTVQNDPGSLQGFDPAFPLRSFKLKEVMPVSLGIETGGGQMTILVPRNAGLPKISECIFSTEVVDQALAVIRVFEGEATIARDNNCLGSLHMLLSPTLKPRPGAPRIKVTFDVDADAILRVSVEDVQGKNVKTVKLRRGVSTDSEVRRVMEAADAFALEDVENRERVKARDALEQSCYRVRAALADYRGRDEDWLHDKVANANRLEQGVQDILDWLDFGDPLLHVAAQLRQRFPKYSFGYDGQTLATDAPLRKLETPLKESNKGYREALESITERDTLQVLAEMDCERSYRGTLLKDSVVSKMKKREMCKRFEGDFNASMSMDMVPAITLRDFEPDPLQQEQRIVAELMKVAAAAQEELRLKFATADKWISVPGKPNTFECKKSPYADLLRDPGIKTEARVRQKANAKYRHLLDDRFARVRDIARIALSYDTLEGLVNGLQRIREAFNVVEIENRFAKPTALGWRDVTILIQIQVPEFCTSHICEIQMSHMALVRARQDLHKHWKLVRELLPGTCKVAADDMDEVQDTILCELESPHAGSSRFTTSQFKLKLNELSGLVASCGFDESFAS